MQRFYHATGKSWYSAKMPKKITKSKPTKATPGPKPDILKIEGDWKDAMKKAMGKKKPASGWPK